MDRQINLVYAMHRPETLELIHRLMDESDTIILEEPELDCFLPMLEGDTPVETYLQESETEYPEYSRRQCAILQQLHQQGRALLQVEPYLQLLSEIHDFFGDGKRPTDIDNGSLHYQVYEAEREATGRLIEFYQAMTTSAFPVIIDHVMSFARADSKRIRLRDVLRGNALIERIPQKGRVFIEAGPIHRSLEKILRAANRFRPAALNTIFIDEIAARQSGSNDSLLSPGDEYTLALVAGEQLSDQTSRLLCARALIYNKLITKEEITDSSVRYPHIQEEQKVIGLVNSLDFLQCDQLFKKIRFASTETGRIIVNDYLENDQRNVIH